MEDYLALIDTKMDSLRFLSREIRDTPLDSDTENKHCELRAHYIVILRSIDKVLTLCHEDVEYQIKRLSRHIDELKAVKM